MPVNLFTRSLKQIFFVSGILLGVSNSFSQTNLQFLSATTGAACYEVEYYNNYLFAGTGNTLKVFDVSGNTPFPELFEYRFTSNIDDIKIKGNKLFVAANHAGLSMWDITAPTLPVMLDEYIPDSLNEAAYNIAFYGDTVFVAYKGKMAAFRDNGNSLSLLKRFAYQTGLSKIRGCDVKGNLLAFTAAFGPNAQTGVHLYDAAAITPISFYQQVYCDPEEVVFGKNTNLLNVIGGTESIASFGFDPKGFFYSLDISNPASPAEIYRDTLPGIIGLAISQPMNAENINDTLYVSTQASLDANYKSGDTLEGHVYVYDCSNASNIHLINSLNGGLWHFDAAVSGSRMFVASEWYGIKTLNISNLMNETSLGYTLTGGWNLGSDKYGDRMAVANEGYGLKLFDISYPQKPVLLNADTEGGFCMNTEFSKDGKYIFGFYWTGDDIRVFDAATLTKQASFPYIGTSTADYRRVHLWKDKIAALLLQPTEKKLVIFDVSNPLAPKIDTAIAMNTVSDIIVNPNGKIFIATKDSLSVMDITTRALLVTLPPGNGFQDFTALAEYKDTVYCYISGIGGGLVKYFYDGNNQLVQLSSTVLPIANPKFLAADSFGLYIGYVEQGLYAFDKKTVTQTGYYRHGMEFVHNFLWGIQDLFCKDNLIFLVEYFGQTTLLTNDNGFTSSHPDIEHINNSLQLFPVPTKDQVTLSVLNSSYKKHTVAIVNVMGQTIIESIVESDKIIIDTRKWPEGIYFVLVDTGKGIISKRFIITK